MLRFKVIPTMDKACYLIKINNEIIDHGILYCDNSLLWTQREPTILEYRGGHTPRSNLKESYGTKARHIQNDFISVTCTNSGAGREIFIQEILVGAGLRGGGHHGGSKYRIQQNIPNPSSQVIVKAGGNFGHEHIVSGCSKNIEQVMAGDYSDVVKMDRAGTAGDWIFTVSPPPHKVVFFDENLYFEKEELTFIMEKNR